jgi:hypothetical protein
MAAHIVLHGVWHIGAMTDACALVGVGVQLYRKISNDYDTSRSSTERCLVQTERFFKSFADSCITFKSTRRATR